VVPAVDVAYNPLRGFEGAIVLKKIRDSGRLACGFIVAMLVL
jgi:hypothetical protein